MLIQPEIRMPMTYSGKGTYLESRRWRIAAAIPGVLRLAPSSLRLAPPRCTGASKVSSDASLILHGLAVPRLNPRVVVSCGISLYEAIQTAKISPTKQLIHTKGSRVKTLFLALPPSPLFASHLDTDQHTNNTITRGAPE
jgi:hypothetical protein